MKKKQVERNSLPHKLAIGRITNGLPNESFSIMVLPLGQKMDPGATAPDLYAQPHYLAPSSR
jgi:hypothetical protein